ncbi:MAG: AsmA-like C-terminal domain-containing protein [Rhodospirillaceae bacterium]
MIRRTSILFLEVTLAIAIVLGLLVAGSVWRLSQRPLSLSFLLPYAEETLQSPESPVRVDLDDLILTWGGWERALDIRALGVQLRRQDDTPVARIREVSLSLSFRALLRGRLAPTALELIRPRVLLVRGDDGTIEMGLGESGAAAEGEGSEAAGELLPLLLSELSGMPQPDSSLRYLNRVSVVEAGLRIEDRRLGVHWRARRADITLRRSVRGLRALFDLGVDTGAAPAEFAGEILYDKNLGRTDLHVRFSKLDTAALAGQIDALRDLAALRTELEGTVSADIALDGGILRASFAVASGPGSLAVPGVDAEPIAFSSIDVEGSISRNPGRVTIERASVDFGAASVVAEAVATRIGDEAAVSISAEIPALQIDDLATYWIPGVGGGARDWVLENMRDGTVRDGIASLTVRVGLTGDSAGAVTVDSVNGRFDVAEATIDYLHPMPVIRNAAAAATFSDRRFDFAVHAGEIGALRITEGAVNIWDIGTPREMLSVAALIRGSVPDALALVGHSRLDLLSKVGLDAAGAAGRHATRLSVSLPLIASLSADEVAVSATSNIVGLTLSDVLKGQGISRGRVSLAVDNARLRAEGEADYADTPARFVWEEYFSASPAVRRRLTASLDLDGELRKLFEVDFPDMLSGPVGANILLEEKQDAVQSVSVELDLARAEIDVPRIDWTKPPGQPGKALATAVLRDGRLIELPSVSVDAGGLQAAGSVAFAPDGRRLRQVAVDRFVLGATSVSGTGTYDTAGKLAIVLRGAGFDASGLLNGGGSGNDTPLPPFSLDASVERVWLGGPEPLTGVEMTMAGRDDAWESLTLKGSLPGSGPGSGKDLTIVLGPAATGQEFSFYAADAGDFLRTAEVTDTVRGGIIEINAARGADDTAPWIGRAEMKRFTLVNAPNLARMLTLASLTGIVDVLSGNGIAFDHLTLPFEFRDEVATIRDGQALGSELGITGSGKVDLRNDAIDIDGTLIPAYTLNSLLGRIPVLGPIITGEKGGGIFAAAYTLKGPLDKPEVSVNPLSALAPGFLRNLFGGGEPTGSSRDLPNETPGD